MYLYPREHAHSHTHAHTQTRAGISFVKCKIGFKWELAASTAFEYIGDVILISFISINLFNCILLILLLLVDVCVCVRESKDTPVHTSH